MTGISAQTVGAAILIIAALGVLISFQLWLVGAAVLLLVAAFVMREACESSKVEKLESRMSIIQVSGDELAEKTGKSIAELSNAINFLRGELQQVARNMESRVAAIEQAVQSTKPDVQKYYDLMQKVIELENRVSAISNRERGEAVAL
ncbi:MAG: hypothetical protein QW548_01805 [Candidatus Aenigmatarchaeota archaeon]